MHRAIDRPEFHHPGRYIMSPLPQKSKHYIDSFYIRLVVLLINQKDYLNYPVRKTGHDNFDFFHVTLNTQRYTLFTI